MKRPPERPRARRRPRESLTPRLRDDATIKIIGLGGVGGILARYLTLFLSSLRTTSRLVLIDGDQFEEKNLSRMFFSRPGNKAAVLREELLAIAGNSRLTIGTIQEYVREETIADVLHDGDIVFLAVDNHATRKLVSDYCGEHLADVCVLSGGNDGVGKDSSGRFRRGTFGNVQIHVRKEGRDLLPPLTDQHPEIQNPTDRIPSEASCLELMSSTPQILFANLMTATSLLNAFWLHTCGELHYAEACFDIYDCLMRPVRETS